MNEFENNELNNESEQPEGTAEKTAQESDIGTEEAKLVACTDSEDGDSGEIAPAFAVSQVAVGGESEGDSEDSGEIAPAFAVSQVTVGGDAEDLGETVYICSENACNCGENECNCGEDECNCGEDGEITLNKKKSAIAFLYEYLETFCYALSLMMILFLFVFRYVSVDGDSMMDTLHDKDKLIISDLFYTPETGDIVVINPESHGDNGEPIIKRVIATEGQTVYIDYENWEVYVDGVKLDEPYIEAMREVEQQRWGEDIAMNGTTVTKYKSEFTVSEGKVFVMGDNRNNSKDSRSREYGEMDENRILGRVIIRISRDFGTVD